MRPDDPNLREADSLSAAGSNPSGVLIMGARRGAIFVPTQILILADCLGDQEAIRGWLAEHGIRVAAPCELGRLATTEQAEKRSLGIRR
jgi:hypothetical protein